MDKDSFFMNESGRVQSSWNAGSFVMEMQGNELNCGSEQLPSSFFNTTWDNSMDQSDPFESALSSMVSSPATSNAGIPGSGGGGDSIVLRELIGRLGSICNSGDISPQSYIGGGGNNNSTTTTCYNSPLNSPPKLNLSVMERQIRGNLTIPGNQLPNHPNLVPFSTDPGFAERAARFSCFGGGTFGSLNGLNESEFPNKMIPRMEPGKLSRVSSNQSIKVSGSPMGLQEIKDDIFQDGIPAPDKKFSRLSRSSTPEKQELGDSREESSVSEQIPVGETGMRVQFSANSRKRKSLPKGKSKEIPPSFSVKDAKVAEENEESEVKRSKSNESNGNEKEAANGSAKTAGAGNQKQMKENPKPPEPPKDYIHVRARRGQATDSHSLAERVRREKISERMKFLQDLVPGCNKVTGKAVMLDEIINYVQSLQRQVEFLSMKLATVNPRLDIDMEALLSKDILQSRGSLPHGMYPLEASSQVFPYALQSQQQGSNGLPNGIEASFSMHPVTAAIHRSSSMHLPSLDGCGEAAPQASMCWEDDLQILVQMGFGQNQPQNLHGTMATARMKIEL